MGLLLLAVLSVLPASQESASAMKPIELRAECAEGRAVSCIALGLMHKLGEGAYQDDAAARRYLRRACDLGRMDGCRLLAVLLEDGRGGDVDEEGAVRLYGAACDGGDAEACGRLGLYWDKRADHARAAGLYMTACRGNDAVACHNLAHLGVVYLEGRGVEKDARRGSLWLGQSCAGGDPSACRVLRRRPGQ